MNRLLGTLNGLARKAAYRSDVVIAAFMMLAIIMLVIPLPTVLVDVLIAINIAFSLLILTVAFYIGRPVDFSSLPPIILLSTLFRLALSVTTTRLILLQADAGEIVATFGRFVIGGEVVIGLVVFLIITAAQFIVITKGAERVAEVGARFTLDAMPGKQMSIDNDLRNGDIDQAEARSRRSRLERESQLYGAMDGAMKFVKGDAICGLIIVFVNLVGGLLVGMLSRGMSFGDASHTYSLLTVGDGLIAQIPALLISIAAGTVVTRVASEGEGDLGSEIFGQLGSSDRALSLAAVILVATAFVPGFPMFIFLGLGGLCGLAAFFVHRRKSEQNLQAAAELPANIIDQEVTPVLELTSENYVISSGPTRHRVVVYVGNSLSRVLGPERFRTETDEVREALRADLGLEFPAVELRLEPTLMPEKFHIDLEGVPIIEGELPSTDLMLNDDPMHLDLIQVPYHEGPPLLSKRRTMWIAGEHAPTLEEAGIGALDAAAVLARCLSQTLRRYSAHFIGIQETRELLTSMEEEYGELVKEVTRVVPLNKLSDILRRLVEEDVPIGNLRTILEALVEWAGKDTDAMLLTERARAALARQICHRHAQLSRVVPAYVLARSTEEAIRNALKQTGVGTILALPDETSRAIVSQLQRDDGGNDDRPEPVILTSMDIRRIVRNFLQRNDIDLPVLSYQEIAPEYSVQSLMTVSLRSQNRNQSVKSVQNQGGNRSSNSALTPSPA